MELQARVVNRFRAKEHDNHTYQPGDIYPAEGYEADAERVAFLSEVHPQLKKIYLADVRDVGVDEDKFPKNVGDGFYELSNGEKVKGKKAAVEAEKALNSKE